MSLVQILGLVFTALLLVIWGMRSVHKGYERGEEEEKLPPVPESLLSESYSVYDKPDALEKYDTRPIPLQDLDTATNR